MNNLAQMSGEPKRTFRDTTQRGVAGKGQIPTMVNQTGLEEDSDDSDKPAKRSGRRKIKIEYIEDKNRRHITFSKRKAGIMKKAYELSTLTGTQVLLLVVSETGLVYTFTTVKLQPIVTKPEGKNLIQACLNAPDPQQENPTGADFPDRRGSSLPEPDQQDNVYPDERQQQKQEQATPQMSYSQAGYAPPPPQQINSGNGYPPYGMNPSYQQPYPGQVPYYGNQSYMPQTQPYWGSDQPENLKDKNPAYGQPKKK
ncbi:transcription factor of the MADS box [Umbelopsis sp. WA50703]